MKHLLKYLLALLFAGSPVFAQANPHEQLHSAFVFEQQGQFDQAITTIKPLMDSNRLSGYERASTMLGVAHEVAGNFVEAQQALERALRILEHDPQHVTEYATTLQKYAGLYSAVG